jgi:hypothetical protein
MSKRTPKEVWQKLVDEAGEEEIERAASVSVEQAEKELAAAGFDVAAERATANAFLEALERGELPAPATATATATAPATAPATATEPEAAFAVPQDPVVLPDRRRPVVFWLAAAATVTVGGGLLYAALRPPPAPPPPSPEPPPSVPAPVDSVVPDLVAAADLRLKATVACDAKRWDDCLAYLDRARALDPAGDDAPAVKATRDRALRGKDDKK